jgi:hypothetical protein
VNRRRTCSEPFDERPALVVCDRGGRASRRGEGNVQVAGQPPGLGPLQEGTDGQPCGRPGSQPAVQVVLAQLDQRHALLVQPRQQGESLADLASSPAAGILGQAVGGGLGSQATERVPGGEHADEPGVVVRGSGQDLVEPGLEPREVGLPWRKDTGGHQQVTDEVQGLGLRQPVECVVADFQLPGGHGGEDPWTGAGA